MSVVCQYNQHGHCKFGSKCVKIHTVATCDNFPCSNSECNMRHPRLCNYFSAYGRCMFADKCSFLHYSFNRGHHHAASNGLQEIMQAVAEMKEEVKTLRLEVDRLGNVNANLLEMIKDLKEEVDVDRVKRLGKDSRVSQEHVSKPEADSTSSGIGPKVDRDVIVHQCGRLVAACQQRDSAAVQDALDGIAIILATAGELSGVATIVEECGGLHRIEQLQRHDHEDVRSKVVQILELLFPDDFQNEQNVYEQNEYEQNEHEQNEHKGGKGGRTKKRKNKFAAPEKDLETNDGTRTGHICPGRGRKDTRL